MHSLPPESETSGTESTSTSELEPPDIATSDPLPAPQPELEDWVADLRTESPAPQAPESGELPDGLPAPTSPRRFTLILRGVTPGKDLVAEREAVLRTMEKAMMGLSVTDGIHPVSAAYRSDPTAESLESVPTDTVTDAADTDGSSNPGGPESSDSLPPSSSDGSPSASPE